MIYTNITWETTTQSSANRSLRCNANPVRNPKCPHKPKKQFVRTFRVFRFFKASFVRLETNSVNNNNEHLLLSAFCVYYPIANT